MQEFNVIDENGTKSLAKVLTTFMHKENRYLIYSIDKDNDEAGIYVSRLIKDKDGYDEIVDIEDEEEKKEIDNIVKELLKNVK